MATSGFVPDRSLTRTNRYQAGSSSRFGQRCRLEGARGLAPAPLSEPLKLSAALGRDFTRPVLTVTY